MTAGIGFGAGGGGECDYRDRESCNAGADGVVVVEWDTPVAHEQKKRLPTEPTTTATKSRAHEQKQRPPTEPLAGIGQGRKRARAETRQPQRQHSAERRGHV